MSLVIDLPEILEERIDEEAERVGLSPSAYVVQLLQKTVLPDSASTQEATRALFARWDDEDRKSTTEERESEEKIFRQIQAHGIPRTQI